MRSSIRKENTWLVRHLTVNQDARFLSRSQRATLRRADRTNAVAAALTTLLRHHWPGEKPLYQITATRRQAGKGTITDFARGSVGKADILYESIDWPMQARFQRQVKLDPDLGVINFDNVRLDSAGGRYR